MWGIMASQCVLPSAFQLANSIASNLTPSVLLTKVKHSAVVQCFVLFFPLLNSIIEFYTNARELFL